MEKITYFGTKNGECGHYPKGINYDITYKEKEYYNRCDGFAFMACDRMNYDKSIKASYRISDSENITIYSIPYSVDDDWVGSHTVLFYEGNHSLEEMENIIIENNFLCHQFDMKNRGRIK